MKVFAGNNDNDREVFKASLVDMLRTSFGITLICASNSCTLPTSQVNVRVSAMSEALYNLGVQGVIFWDEVVYPVRGAGNRHIHSVISCTNGFISPDRTECICL